MPTPETERRGLVAAAKRVAGHASVFVRLERELARIELERKTRSLGVGIALGLATVVFGLLTLAFGLAAATAGIATALPTWAAILVMLGGVFLLTAVFGLGALVALKRGTPPVPEQALEEARLTFQALRRNGR